MKTVNQSIETQIKVNGHLPQAFPVKRGMQQGYPLSMILYIIFAEIFLENIRQSNGIKGIVIGEKELKTSAFADDATIYLGSNSSVAHLKTQLMHFEKATGIKYNKAKCMGTWLGSNKGNPRKPLGFKWNPDTIKFLGYTYRHNTIQTREENWEKVSKKSESINRSGSIYNYHSQEKILLLNQVMLSKIWYKIQCTWKNHSRILQKT